MFESKKNNVSAGDAISQRISVIIPTLNAADWLDGLLEMLQQQTRKVEEVLLVDSGSSDNTREIGRKYNAKIISIAPEDFDHGGTRSMAGRLAQGDILVYMTQDAIPANSMALEKLIAALLGDKRIAAAYGRQLPNHDATIFSEHLRLFNYPPVSNLRCWQDRFEFGFKTIFISNSFAAYKKEVLEKHGYFPDRLLFGEDTCTVAKLLEHDYCVAYASDACVYHSHNYTITQDFKRYFDIGVFHVCQYHVLDKFGTPTGAGKKFVKSEITLLLKRGKSFLLPESLLRSIAKYFAYNLGKHYSLLPRRLAAYCSLHPHWWL